MPRSINLPAQAALWLCLLFLYSGLTLAADRALLVGVEKYGDNRVPETPGCVQDALQTAEFLKSRYNFADSSIKVLTNEAATSTSIEQEFRRWLIEGTQPGDRVFFLYAGHGSQLKDDNGDEADGLDETIAPYDVNPETGAGEIRDDVFDEMIAALSGRRAVLVFDSCHSGTISRDIPKLHAFPRGGGARYLPRPDQFRELSAGTREIGGANSYSIGPAPQSRDLKRVGGFLDSSKVKTLSGVVVISAAASTQRAYPVEVGSTLRGALSYVFAETQQANVPTLRELKTRISSRVNALHTGSHAALAFGAGGKLLATGGEEGSIAVWDTATGRRVRTLKGVDAVGLAFSPDGVRLVSLNFSTNASISIWDVATGNKREVEFEISAGSDYPQEIVFSPDGQLFATGGYGSSDEGTVRLYDTVTGRLLTGLSGHKNTVRSIAFGPRGRTLITASLDGMLKLWDVAARRELASLVGIDEQDWLIVTPDGLFDGSHGGWTRALWRFSPQLYDMAPVEAYFAEFYTPGLLTDLLDGIRPKAAQDIAQKDRRQPSVSLATSTNVTGALTSPTIEAQIRISAAQAGAQDVRLFRNGSLIHVWHGDALRGKTETVLTTTLPVVAGENRLTAYAFNRDNVKSSDATLMLTGAESLRRKGTAYVLALGVNTYANKDFDLKYAVADAQDFSQEWQTQQTKLQTFASTEIIALKDADATKSNILKSLADLKAKVKPEDALVIYFAGHGTAQQNRFYLIPYDLGYAGGRDAIDETGLKTILMHSISDLELQDALEGVDAGQLLMVIDACNSGQALESEEKRRGPMNSKGLAQLAYEKGMYILTAAQSYQAAQEASKFGHGFLTFALVEEGIKQTKADDDPKDGQVIAREWFDYATQRVPQMQAELMNEAGGRGVKVAFIKGEEQIADPAKRNVQHPRVFYRRELEAQPLVVAKP